MLLWWTVFQWHKGLQFIWPRGTYVLTCTNLPTVGEHVFCCTQSYVMWLVSPCSSLSTPQPDFLSWGCPQWQCHTDLASPSTPQWTSPVLSATAVIFWWGCICEHNRQHHHHSAVWPNPWYPVQYLSEGLHCGLWTIQCSAQCMDCWWWGYLQHHCGITEYLPVRWWTVVC